VLEFAARVNKELSPRPAGRVTIVMQSNIDPEPLRASIEARPALEERAAD